MHIDVWSDVICPWCFLGKRRLDAALAQLGWADEVTVRWRAYQLDPGATATPRDLRSSVDRKYGPGAFDAMTGTLTPLGATVGIDYRFDLALRVSTFDAHRLLAWAWAVGGAAAQSAAAERLFVAYFTEGANVADHAVLTEAASAAGLSAKDAAAMLDGHDLVGEVDADLSGARARELTGVPAFVVADRLLIPGAQEVATFVSVLARARERFGSGPAT